MSTTVSLNAIALRILQRAPALPGVPDRTPTVGDALVAAANGIDIPTASDAQSQAKAKISESLSDNGVDLQQLKVHLFTRLGEALGIDLDSYDDLRQFASALRHAVAQIKLSSDDGGTKLFTEIGKELGLDKLGISIDELINAIDDPDGNAGQKLNEALRAATGEDAKAAARGVMTDENGLYSPHNL